jgi:hypothetical protein
VTVSVLEAAVRESGLADSRSLRGLEAFIADTAESGQAAAASDDLDAAAWKAQEEGDDAQYQALWRKARAASAIAAALDGEFLDAVYEGAHALDDPLNVVALVG